MTLSAYVKPKLLGLGDELAAVVPRVVAGDDAEAVHDLRVALRKLRSVLRAVRRLYGRFHVDAVRAGFKRVADATGALRDEEVLGETLAALELSPRARESLGAWQRGRRAGRERKLRRDVVSLVGGGALDAPLAVLRALLTLPVEPGRDKPAARFARKIVFDALDDVERAQPSDSSDAEALHALRILYKRLRYAIDAFAGVLPPEFEALERAAAAFQKRLGTVHDLDVALDVIAGAEELSPEARAEILAALGRERARQIEKYERERARGAARQPAASAPAALDGKAPRDEAAAEAKAPRDGAARGGKKGAGASSRRGEGRGGEAGASGAGRGARKGAARDGAEGASLARPRSPAADRAGLAAATPPRAAAPDVDGAPAVSGGKRRRERAALDKA